MGIEEALPQIKMAHDDDNTPFAQLTMAHGTRTLHASMNLAQLEQFIEECQRVAGHIKWSIADYLYARESGGDTLHLMHNDMLDTRKTGKALCGRVPSWNLEWNFTPIVTAPAAWRLCGTCQRIYEKQTGKKI